MKRVHRHCGRQLCTHAASLAVRRIGEQYFASQIQRASHSGEGRRRLPSARPTGADEDLPLVVRLLQELVCVRLGDGLLHGQGALHSRGELCLQVPLLRVESRSGVLVCVGRGTQAVPSTFLRTDISRAGQIFVH